MESQTAQETKGLDWIEETESQLARPLVLRSTFLVISEREKRASSAMFVFNRDFRYVRIYYKYSTLPRGICIR